MLHNESYFITQLAISSLGLTLNATLFLMVIAESSSFNPSSYLPVWICFSDVILNANNFFFGLYALVKRESLLELSNDACAVDAFVVIFSCSSSLLLLLGLTYLRYSIIVKEVEVKLSYVKWGIAGSFATGAISAALRLYLDRKNIFIILR
ncbi:hypothetical protein BCR33DRAFT_785385 [Rhizoclosmatium globosum]|uniref:G-protein coupled receptors family 1 profile domain-containing protein n=1 Tax=Rhizoclosmatium globosum TaxID=329046 RepID=A0A1Y2CAU1_9FUNG|nr:hypothetical protein BCR33DRAFT_785385 [Rhizoclosmatium globosum]|eukprot:ORY44159.1 hypothetical protein BCR33DRAFT_785385 [Rhizoclosmatium globosum]